MSSERIEQFYRDATDKDVLRAMKGETVEARFSDEMTAFFNSTLGGWQKQLPYEWLDGDGARWQFCQVYDPPQWYVDKPEPGEGYRLLGKFPDEDLQPGDEVFDLRGDRKWEPSWNVKTKHPQDPSSWYRRRIEQPKPEPKFAVGQRVQIVGPPIKGEGPIYNWCVEMDKYIGATEFVRSQPQQTFEGVFYQVSNIANWSFREDYLEAVVEPKPEPKHYTLNVGDTCDVPSGHRITVTEHGIEVQ